MSPKRRAVTTLVAVAVLAIPLAVASIAFACARLSTLKLDRASGTPGTQTDAIGRNYNFDTRSSAVTLRFNSRRGPVLWEGRANRQGRIRASFEVPRARPGHYVILATQTTEEGRPVAGTPGRAPLRIRAASRRRASASVAPAAAPPPAPPRDPGGGPPALPAAPASLIVLALLGGSAAIVLAGRRRAPDSRRRP